jgi:hypothetical protein
LCLRERFRGLRNKSLMLFPTFNGIGKDFIENMEGRRLNECLAIGQGLYAWYQENMHA